jgi:hypothetical protein
MPARTATSSFTISSFPAIEKKKEKEWLPISLII